MFTLRINKKCVYLHLTFVDMYIFSLLSCRSTPLARNNKPTDELHKFSCYYFKNWDFPIHMQGKYNSISMLFCCCCMYCIYPYDRDVCTSLLGPSEVWCWQNLYVVIRRVYNKNKICWLVPKTQYRHEFNQLM